jgi:transcriptional antiterminator Rof (Rho-off)
MSDCRPVACGFYDLLEIAILRRQRLQARWCDPSGAEVEACTGPRDLRIRDAAEYLIAVDADGRHLELRLDRIRSAAPAGSDRQMPRGP